MQYAGQLFFVNSKSAFSYTHAADTLLFEERIDTICAKSEYVGDLFDGICFGHVSGRLPNPLARTNA